MSEPGLSTLLMNGVEERERGGASAVNYLVMFGAQALAALIGGSGSEPLRIWRRAGRVGCVGCVGGKVISAYCWGESAGDPEQIGSAALYLVRHYIWRTELPGQISVRFGVIDEAAARVVVPQHAFQAITSVAKMN